MVNELKETAWYKTLALSILGAASDLKKRFMRVAGAKALKFLSLAVALSILANILLLLFVPFRNIAYNTIQFMWPVLSLFLLSRIYYVSIDKNVKSMAKMFYIVLVPWTVTLLLWEVILPTYYYYELAFYLTGFGFLISYAILIYGLLRFKNSKQLSLVSPFGDRAINGVGVLAILALSIVILVSMNWKSGRAVDTLILAVYLASDVVIISLCVKLLLMNVRQNMNYLIIVILGFISINTVADIIYEARWLFSISNISTYPTGQVTNMIYNVSLMFMTIALLLYNSNVKNKAMDTMSNKLKDSRLFVEDIIMQAPYAICVFGTGGDLVLANDSFLNLFELKRADIVGRYNLFNEKNEVGVNFNGVTSKLKMGKTMVLPRIDYRRVNGEVLYLSARLFPTFGTNGSISNYVAIIEDITERLKAEQELVAAKTHAELYVDLMGHDINNIHQTAMGYLELASDKLATDGGLDRESAMLIKTPMENLRNGSMLIDNVRKLQAEKTGLYKKNIVEIDRVLEEVRDQFSYPPEREIHVDYQIASGCSVIANDLLKDVFVNIIGNSIKHSTSALNITVRSERIDEDDNKQCKVTIEDDGPGIIDARKSRVFDRMDGDQGRRTGKGIGLYLVKTLIDDYGGKIWVEDRVQGDHTKGARFMILLPAVEK